MSDETPERIWLLLGEGEDGTHVWCDNPNPSGSGEHEAVGYVREDAVERITAERDAALAREAEKDSAIRELSAEVRLRRVQCGRMGMALSHIKEANNLDGARMTADIALIVASPENIPHDAGADTQSPSDRLGAWLSAALDDPQVCEEMKADIRAWFDSGAPAAAFTDMPPDQVLPDRAQAEAAAFRAGAEAMRSMAIGVCEEQIAVFSSSGYAMHQPIGAIHARIAVNKCERVIRALPLPAHQSTGDAT